VDGIRIARDTLYFTLEAAAVALAVYVASRYVAGVDSLAATIAWPASVPALLLLTALGLAFSASKRFRGWLERRDVVDESLRAQTFVATKMFSGVLAIAGAGVAYRNEQTVTAWSAGFVLVVAAYQYWRGPE